SVSVTSSPGDSTANPKMSNPQETLATVAGANARTVFISACIMANPDDIRKHAGGRNSGTRPGTANDHGTIVIALRRQQNNVVASRQRIEGMVLSYAAQLNPNLAGLQHRHVPKLLAVFLRFLAQSFKRVVVFFQRLQEILHGHITAAVAG